MTYYNKVTNRECHDCGHDTALMGERYMVHNWLWEQAGRNGDWPEMLCIGCIEHRLERTLTRDDFFECGLNSSTLFNRSIRLKSRLRSRTR